MRRTTKNGLIVFQGRRGATWEEIQAKHYRMWTHQFALEESSYELGTSHSAPLVWRQVSGMGAYNNVDILYSHIPTAWNMKIYVDDDLEVEKNVTWRQLKLSSRLPSIYY